MKTIYLKNNLAVQINVMNNVDNIEFRFKWNKPLDKLPFEKDYCDCMEEIVVHKNSLMIYLTKQILLSNPNREIILSKMLQYINTLKNTDSDSFSLSGPTSLSLYIQFLTNAHKIILNKKKDIHIALIEAIWQLWI